MDKRKLHHRYVRLRRVKPWYFLLASVLFLALGIYGLRQNNFKMIELREAVIQADENNGDVEGTLNNLRSFVHGHMNTDLSSGEFAIKPPIQLKNRYEKLAQIEAERTKELNKEVQQKAEALCGQRHPGAGFNSPRVACIADYMRINALQENEVPSELYKFDFVSPKWSPDLAGLSLLFSTLFFAAFIARLLTGWWYRRIL
jgi:hypothetical protein